MSESIAYARAMDSDSPRQRAVVSTFPASSQCRSPYHPILHVHRPTHTFDPSRTERDCIEPPRRACHPSEPRLCCSLVLMSMTAPEPDGALQLQEHVARRAHPTIPSPDSSDGLGLTSPTRGGLDLPRFIPQSSELHVHRDWSHPCSTLGRSRSEQGCIERSPCARHRSQPRR
ncbi:hypothetical protein L226DRAFT_213212 [Lentinus tigrinus ALCF2SS1-7]|uniref:uncharacterized protein n=1 Tax=Lentinus tigrinus ALCF2SS1-7 TaxID=1328758 RepID=UPI001165FF9D|nr:hypothetical protein L226DRAFT_213212 [Lentinus tigrinus ALCF2SS1-7]